MSQAVQEFKNTGQNTQVFDGMSRIKRAQTDQSLNTRNFIKRMSCKSRNKLSNLEGEVEEKAQTKITAYMNISNSTSYGGQRDQNVIPNVGINSQDQRIRDLEERMKQRDLQIQKMKRARQIDQNRFSSLFTQNRDQKKKSRQAVAKSMLEAAQYRRSERRQINPRLGYFKDGIKFFVEGCMLTDLRHKIKQKLELIKQLQEEKKSKDHQKKQRAVFKIEFVLKVLTGYIQETLNLQRQLQSSETYVNTYKQQLKLADKQVTCQYALKGWPIAYDQFQSLQLLGKGGFGQVYKCYDLESNHLVALKVNHFNEDPAHQQDFIKHVQRQAQVMKKLNHPNIAKFIKLLQCQGNKVVFALQYCSGPELSVYLRRNGCLQEKQAKQIIRQLFAALNYLSSLKQKIIHYDIKPSNIMFHHGLLKILDFGLCKPMGNEQSRIQLTSQGVGTYWYLPPETFDDNFPQITPKVDVWSSGVILYQILYGRKPYGHGVSQDKIYNQGIILNAKKIQFPTQTPKKYKVSDSVKNFIRQCLAYNPQERLSPSQAYEHEYFKR